MAGFPDHSTFSKNRYGRFQESGIYRTLFEEVVSQCQAAGLVGGEGFAVDGTLIAANAKLRQPGGDGGRTSGESTKFVGQPTDSGLPSGAGCGDRRWRPGAVPSGAAIGDRSTGRVVPEEQAGAFSAAWFKAGSHARLAVLPGRMMPP